MKHLDAFELATIGTAHSDDRRGVLPGMGRCVLLVDDDATQAKLARLHLESAGFEVETVETGREALSRLETLHPDVIVSDVVMDDINGFSFCRIIRTQPHLAGVPVVLMSSYFNPTRDIALAAGVGATAIVEREPSMQPCIETIVRSLASKKTTPSSPNPKQPLERSRATTKRHLMPVSVPVPVPVQCEKDRYEAIFEHANDAISILDTDGRVIDVNRRWEEIMQRPRSELVGLHIRNFSAPGYGDLNEQRFRDTVSVQGIDRAIPIGRPDGSVVWLEFTTTRLAFQGREQIIGIGRDVTDVVEARQRHEASERKYKSLVQNIPEVIWSASIDLKLTFMSGNVERMCGFTSEEMLQGAAGSALERVHPDDLELTSKAFRALADTRAPMDVEYRWLHRDGRWRWFHCRAVSAVDDNGAPCIDGLFSDVTTRKNLEEQVRLAQKVEAIGQLTAGIAHDFNNILAVIMTNGDYLLHNVVAEEESHEVMLEIQSAAERGAALAGRLLAFGRRRVTPEIRDVNVNTVLEDVEKLLGRTLGRAIELTFVKAPELPPVRIDTSEVEQVLMNLAVNARDAMPNGGKLVISTCTRTIGPETTPDIRGMPTPGDYVVLSVRDTGTGMGAEALERLFEPFFTTKEPGKGTGLGLSVSYGIIRRHNGQVTVESKIGEGTTFTIYLPIVKTGTA